LGATAAFVIGKGKEMGGAGSETQQESADGAENGLLSLEITPQRFHEALRIDEFSPG
jgi:hypothetical protein